eukprot:TRINITY_DN18205_c0_g2_i1.p1 TRINITY_DN18205_c0_g2~~TRINITY_DN18205_c0_g2_i1.p1  ORF type:complete len:596 (+),score=178.38 TRINITY_DN18205_c0_g2_i1:233-2020(+)
MAVPDAGMKDVDKASSFFDEGRKALLADDYDKAIELLCEALQIRVKAYGELAPECASAYYLYGKALFYKARSETEAFGATVENPDEEEGDEDAEAETGAGASAGEHANGNGAATNGGVEGTGDEEGEEQEEEEEEGDQEIAWKLLETAKVIHKRQGIRTVEEADVIATIADISLEKEDFETCQGDYAEALDILEGLLPPDDRSLAEICFKICYAYGLAGQPKEALAFCRRAIAICDMRLLRLKREAGIDQEVKKTVSAKGKEKVGEAVPAVIEKEDEDKGVRAAKKARTNSTIEEGGQGTATAGGYENGEASETGEGVAGTGNMVGANGKAGKGKEKEETAKRGTTGLVEEIAEIEGLLVDLKEKEEDLLQQAKAPSLQAAMGAVEETPGMEAYFRDFLKATIGAVVGGESSPHAKGANGTSGTPLADDLSTPGAAAAIRNGEVKGDDGTTAGNSGGVSHSRALKQSRGNGAPGSSGLARLIASGGVTAETGGGSSSAASASAVSSEGQAIAGQEVASNANGTANGTSVDGLSTVSSAIAALVPPPGGLASSSAAPSRAVPLAVVGRGVKRVAPVAMTPATAGGSSSSASAFRSS